MSSTLSNCRCRIRASTLGNEIDPLGMPRLVVKWRFRELEIDAIAKAYRILASSVAKAGIGKVMLGADLAGSIRRALVPQGGHHIGTVRMSSDPSQGVVNTECEVWGTRGLYAAGTGVLTTSGFANPTLSALALSLRLVEHLAQQNIG